MSRIKNDRYPAHISSLRFSSVLDTFHEAKDPKSNFYNVFHEGRM